MIDKIITWLRDFHFHKWKYPPLTKGMILRQFTSRRWCSVCGKHEVRKTWTRSWMETGRILNREEL